MYGQIISFLFLLLVLYYVAMILLDIQKDRAMKAAELEKNNEEEIDISEEASSFQPVMITREDLQKKPQTDSKENGEKKPDSQGNEKKQDNEKAKSTDNEKKTGEQPKNEKQPENKDQSPSKADEPKTNPQTSAPASEKVDTTDDKDFRRPGYREATMTDYVYVKKLIDEMDSLVETGYSDLGNIIYCCQNAR